LYRGDAVPVKRCCRGESGRGEHLEPLGCGCGAQAYVVGDERLEGGTRFQRSREVDRVQRAERRRIEGGCARPDDGARLTRRSRPRRGLLEADVHALVRQVERLRHIAADPHGERLAELRVVAERVEVELERLRLDAALGRLVGDRRDGEVGPTVNRAERAELVARRLDRGDTGVREGLEPGIAVGAGAAERDEA
jgi:hypothetical protein